MRALGVRYYQCGVCWQRFDSVPIPRHVCEPISDQDFDAMLRDAYESGQRDQHKAMSCNKHRVSFDTLFGKALCLIGL